MILAKDAHVSRKEVTQTMAMSAEARQAQAAYRRKWYASNKDKQREYQQRYWERKAAQNQKKSEEIGNGPNVPAQGG